MSQMQKTILSSSLHIKNVQAERLDIYSQTFYSLPWASRRNNNNNNKIIIVIIIIIIIILTKNYLFTYLFRNFLRIKNLGIRDFILFNLFLFLISETDNFILSWLKFKTLDCLQELLIAYEQQGVYLGNSCWHSGCSFRIYIIFNVVWCLILT